MLWTSTIALSWYRMVRKFFSARRGRMSFSPVAKCYLDWVTQSKWLGLETVKVNPEFPKTRFPLSFSLGPRFSFGPGEWRDGQEPWWNCGMLMNVNQVYPALCPLRFPMLSIQAKKWFTNQGTIWLAGWNLKWQIDAGCKQVYIKLWGKYPSVLGQA